MANLPDARQVAENLRGMAKDATVLSDGEFIDFMMEIVRGAGTPAPRGPDTAFLNRLADLIDPTAYERAAADSLALIERDRELECELEACRAKLGRVSRIAETLQSSASDAFAAYEGRAMPPDVARLASPMSTAAELLREMADS